MRFRRLRPLAYVGALAVVALAFGVVRWTWPLFEPVPFMLFYAAVAASVWFGGAGAGLAAIVFSAVLVQREIIPTVGSTVFQGGGGFVRLGVYVCVCGFIVWLLATLGRARRRLAGTLDSIPDACLVLDRDARFLYANAGGAALLASSPHALVGKRLRDVEAKEDDAFFAAELAATLHSRQGGVSERRFESLGKWLSLSLWPIEDGLLVLARDVTEQKAAEADRQLTLAALAESEQSLRLALDAGHTGVWDWNIPDDRITWSERVYEFHGVEPGSFGGRVEDFTKLVHPEDLQRVSDAIRVAIEEHQPYVIEFRVRRPSGETRWIYTSGRALYDDTGRPVRMLGATRDVTDERRAQDLARESEARFRFTADSAPVLIWIAGPDKLCTWFNRPWLEFTGRSLEQELGNGWAEGVHPSDLAECLSTYHAAFDAREPFTMEYRLRRHDGEWRWIFDSGVPLSSPSGEFTGYIGSCMDIHDRKRTEQERALLLVRERAMRGELEHANRMKDDFLATLSHELRTPLQAILGWSRLIRGGRLGDTEREQAIEIIERSAGQQAQLIEDLLDLSRITSGKMQLDVQRVDLPGVIEAALGTVGPAADAKQIRVRRVLDPLAGPVAGDPRRLQQVVWNLLSNAIKFTPKGGQIEVLLQRVTSHVEIHVSDTGQGMEPGFLPHVFDRFRQADASTTRRHEGLGIGLAIVRQLVELHGGTVWARSEGVGRGASFSVSLPLSVVHARRDEPGHPRSGSGDTAPVERVSLAGIRVVVVDDNHDTLQMLGRVLRDYHAEVDAAQSVPEALELVLARPPDVLVSDIGMPGQDGYDLIRALRTMGGKAAAVPAIALTAFARSEDRTRAMLSGYQVHLAKPVEPAELIATVANIAGRAGAKPAERGTS